MLPLAAVGIVVAAGVVGSAIDMSQAYRVDNRLQAACDAAVLAGRHAVSTNGFDSSAKTVADNYFATNFSDETENTTGTVFTPSSDDDGVTVKGVASTTYSTLVMRLFGFNTFNLSVSCTSSMSMGNADVMFVLDTTGSMGNSLDGSTRIQALRDAMNNFYTTVANATGASNARIRYGFVPFSTTVNVGHLLYDLDPDYIADSHDYQSREYTSATSNSTSGTSTKNWTEYSNKSYSSESTCEAAMPGSDTDYSAYGNPVTTSSTSSDVKTTQVAQQYRLTTYACATSSSSLSYNDGYSGPGSFGFNAGGLMNASYAGSADGGAFSRANYTIPAGGAYLGSKGDNLFQMAYYGYGDNNNNNGWGSTKYYIFYKYSYYYTYETTTSYYTYKLLTQDTSVYKTFSPAITQTGDDGADVSSTWAGCILERQTSNSSSFSYSSVSGISPSDALDLDIDSAPTSDDATKWAPLWPEVAFVRHSTKNRTLSETTDGEQATSPCPAKAQELEEMDADTFSAYANSLTPSGNTYLDIGMIWGGRLLSPDGIFKSNVNETPANGAEVSRHLIFMTDGEMQPNEDVQQAWGMEWWDRKVTSDGSTDDTARHTSRFRAVCDAIKAKGIRIWVIAFTSSLSSDLTYCASDDSSFVASDADELNTAFQEIAKDVGELRVTS